MWFGWSHFLRAFPAWPFCLNRWLQQEFRQIAKNFLLIILGGAVAVHKKFLDADGTESFHDGLRHHESLEKEVERIRDDR